MKRILQIFLGAVMLTGINLSAKELKVLTIGNSFADSVFVYLPSRSPAFIEKNPGL